MEREKLFTNQGNGITQPWNPIPLNCSLNQFPTSLFNSNCESSLHQRDLFESALSSIVSSPANSHSGIPIPGNESIVLRELIGRLGNICNSGEISPQSCINGNKSNNTSCYTTPINSPPNLHLSITDNPIQVNHHHQLPFPIDPGFVERASRFSCFAGLKETGFPQMMESRSSSSTKDGIPDSHKKLVMPSTQETMELGDSKEESSVSEQNPGGKTQCTNGRKRKMIPKGKGMETPSSTTKDDKGVAEVEKDGKRSKSDEEEKRKEKEKEKEKEKVEWNQKQTKECAKPPEPPKDYIHVRAKRGQATDSHSLAERVRREKISERMKFLQDLVPGCYKVTGKAVMLDEIINYVQALQRQVEFLSMKLATVNPRMDVSMEALLSKDMFRSRLCMPTNMNSFDNSTQPFPYGFQSQNGGMVLDGLENQFSMNTLMATMHRNSIMKPSHVDGFEEASMFWENDLQSVVKMALGQDQPQSFHGQMKVEL